MEIRKIKQIVELMKNSDLSEFEIEQEGLKLRIRRGGVAVADPVPAPTVPAAATAPAPETTAAAVPAPEAPGRIIESPMVGTFYAAPSPESPPFVQPGDSVTEESTVCIIEAMKVMNEIKAEVSGRIVEALVTNGESVEFGQPLFRIADA